MEQITSYLIYLIPLFIIQVVLMIIALISVIKQEKFKIGNKVMWIIIVACINIIGPVIYLLVGRTEE